MPMGVYKRGRHSIITPEMRAQVLADVAEGELTRQEIAGKYKIHITSVHRICQKNGLQGHKSQASDVQTSPEPLAPKSNGRPDVSGKFSHLIPQMRNLRAEGVTYREIAKKLGMRSGGTVRYYLNPREKIRVQSDTEGVTSNGHDHLDTRFLIGFGCAELERTVTAIAQRLGIAPNLLRQGFSKFLGSTPVR